jgi:hypothetical protein
VVFELDFGLQGSDLVDPLGLNLGGGEPLLGQ